MSVVLPGSKTVLTGKTKFRPISRLFFHFLTTILIVIFVCGGIFSAVQPPLQAAEEPYGLSLAALPSKGNPKLDSTLNSLVSTTSTKNSKPLFAQEGISPGSNNVRVIIESLPGRASEVTSIAGAMGMVEGSYQNYIQMVLPAGNIPRVAAMGKVKLVREPLQPLVSAVTSEGLPLINADEWQTEGYDGTGVKIGILDVGFAGYTTRQAEGNLPLPPNITTWWAPGIGNEGSNSHGTACAEIVYDIAPSADFYLANFSTIVEYGNAVDWLISQGVDIISCSVSWPIGGPGNGTGTICQIVDIARTNGILWVQSAGNQAQKHWEGYWNNPDDNSFLNFSGSDEGNSISVNNGDTIVVALKWDDPWYTSSNDFDLLLVDENEDIVAYSFNVQDGDDNPIEILSYVAEYTGNYHLYILSLAGSTIADFHLFSYYHDFEYRMPSGSILVPADSFNAVTVGAVHHATPESLEEFSSRGPTDDGRIKPDLVGPDGVTTATYGTGDFSGTSAAAPHAAGAAALVQQRYESYTTDQLQDFLEGRCVDLGETGRDNLFGNGRLNLGNAVDNYTLKMMVVGNGDVSPEVGQHDYPAGSSVNITAEADPGWQFIKWTGEVEDVNSANTSVTLDKDKTVQAEFNQTTDHYCLTSTVDSQGNVGNYSSIALDSNDNPHISYYHTSNDEVRYTWWDGNMWHIEIVDAEMSTDPYMSLALDNTDSPHISYQKNGSSPDLVYARRNGSIWQIQTVDSLASVGQGSSIQIDTQGHPHISYYDNTNDNLKYAYWNGSKWVIETIDDGSFSGGETSLVLDSADKPHILYSAADTDSGAKYAQKTNGTWDTSTVEVGNDFDVTISLTLDSSDNPHIFGDNKNANTLRYAYWDGSNWQIQDIPDTYATNGDGAITLDSANNPHILYYHDLEYDLMYTWWNGSGWQVITVDIAGNVGSSSSMTMDSTGIVHASYFDLTNIDLKYARILNFYPNFLTISNNGDGTTSPLTGVHAYMPGETVDISITPAPNWEFVNWTGDVANPVSANTTVTMDTDKAVTANLVRVGSILQLSASGSGDVTPSPGIHTYPINEVVALSATPTNGWDFVGWTGDVADPNSASTTITMDTDKSVTANFVLVTTTLTITVNGEGTVTPPAGTHEYPIGEVVNITASPYPGWKFDHWTGNVADPDSASTTITMNTDQSVTAYFTYTGIYNLIAFTSKRDSTYDEIYVMNANGTYQTRLTFNGNNDIQPSLAADCSKIAFVSDRDSGMEIYTMNIDGTGVSRLTNSSSDKYNPEWSPDGTKIAFEIYNGSTTNIYIMNANGSNITQVTTNQGTNPAWSPDGNKLAFISNRSSKDNIYIINTDGTNLNQITDEPHSPISGISWSPDGTRIVYDTFAGVEPQGINIINIDGSGKTALPLTGALQYGYRPVWSPDGTQIAFGTNQYPPIEIYTADIDGSNIMRLTDNNYDDSYPSWASNGAILHLAVSGQGTIEPAAGSHLYEPGEIVDILAAPASGWKFDHWVGDVVQPDAASTTVMMDNHQSVTAVFTANPPPAGGGGGGGMVGVLAFGYNIGTDGRLKSEMRAISENAEAFLILAQGTYCLLDGFPLTFITIMPLSAVDEQPLIPEGTHLLTRIFKLGPEGSTFEPAIQLIFNFKSLIIPEGFSEEDMYIGTWDEENLQWIRLESQLIPENQQIMTEISGFSMYAVMVSPRPAHISVTDLTAVPDEINEGESTTITAFLTNDGDLPGSYEAELAVNGEVKETKVMEIESQGNASVSFDLAGLASGTHQISVGEASVTLTVLPVKPPTPASFTLGPLEITPAEVDINEEVRISVRVDNTGESEGTYLVTCKINDIVEEEKSVSLAGLSSDMVVFTMTFGEAGKKLIDVNDQLGSVIVRGAVPPTEQTPLPAGDNEPSTPTGAVAELDEQDLTDDFDATTTSSWPIVVGVVGSCLVLAVITLYVVRRKRRSTPENPPDST
jgi:uncharacterized repeat protein (TIGR02543 family)